MSSDEQLEEAEDLLAELSRIRQSTRQTLLTSNWGMFVMWGAIFLCSILAFATGVEVLNYYWIAAGPIGAVASFRIGRRTDPGADAGAPMWAYLAVAAFMLVGAFGAFSVLPTRPAILAWWLVLVIGFGLFALFDRQRQLLGAIALVIAWGLVYFAFTEVEGMLYNTLAGAFGGLLLGAGAGLRMVRK